MGTQQADRFKPTVCGRITRDIPIVQTEGVTDEQAAAATGRIINAYIYLTQVIDNGFNALSECLLEIQIAQEVADTAYKYDLRVSGSKIVPKMRHDIAHTEILHCFNAVMTLSAALGGYARTNGH